MLKEFFSDKSAAQLLLIAAAVLLFISQFFYYFDDASHSYLDPGSETKASTLYLDLSSRGTATGWELHKHAYVILVVLAFALLRDDIAGTPWFGRFGYWAALLLIFVATTPGAPFRAPGAAMGMVSCLMALAAALMNMVRRNGIRNPSYPPNINP